MPLHEFVAGQVLWSSPLCGAGEYPRTLEDMQQDCWVVVECQGKMQVVPVHCQAEQVQAQSLDSPDLHLHATLHAALEDGSRMALQMAAEYKEISQSLLILADEARQLEQ